MTPKKPSKTAVAFTKKLVRLRSDRKDEKEQHRGKNKRNPPTPKQRNEILAKTGASCHICGGKIKGTWHADHVVSHSSGGLSQVDNYLPAHQICNSARKAYTPEEFQWIIKLGVWLRTQIANETTVGKDAVEKFCASDKNRVKRQVGSKP